MTRGHLLTIVSVALWVSATRALLAQPDDRIELVARTGTPLQVALDETVTLKRVGQTISGTLVEPLYAYDRVVLPAGTRVVGHLASLENPSKLIRFRAWSSGDFSPRRRATLEFDSVNREGETIPLRALGLNGTPNMRRQVAADSRSWRTAEPEPDGTVARARQAIRQRASETIASARQRDSDAIAGIRQPGRKERLKLMLLDRLPYHRQYLSKGTVYDAQLQAPVVFGRVEQATLAAAGTLPPPSSILRARLATTLDSSTTRRGSRLEAVVSEPVFSADHQLILPEGTRLSGEVTVVKPARRLHRNGQLRFLFDRVQPLQGDATTLLASLHSIDLSANDHVVVDEEGGASVSDSKTRFVAPALALMALAGASDGGEHHLDADDPGFGTGAATVGREGGNLGSRSLGGLFGFGLAGAALGRLSHPVGIAFAAIGVARTMYSNVFGKGQDVRFVEDARIELQLAPGPSPAR